MISALAMMACPTLAVSPQLMYHVAMVESRANPFAIGVVGGRLARQPVDLREAIATARMLEESGYNFSVGIAQVNRANLARYGLDTWEKAFDVCPNLLAASRILAQCYGAAGGAWDKAFSCYYSGDHVTGFRDGYVQKIFASLGQGTPTMAGARTATSIPVLPTPKPGTARAAAAAPLATGGAAHRVAIRTVAMDTPMDAPATPIGAAATGSPGPAPTGSVDGLVGSSMAIPSPVAAGEASLPADPSRAPPPETGVGNDSTVFVPQVTGPGDAPAAAAPASAQQAPPAATGDPADLRQHGDDSAFVF